MQSPSIAKTYAPSYLSPNQLTDDHKLPSVSQRMPSVFPACSKPSMRVETNRLPLHSIRQLLTPQTLISLHFGIVRHTGADDVDHPVVRREARSVGVEDPVREKLHLAASAVEALDLFLDLKRSLVALVDHQSGVTVIREADVPTRRDRPRCRSGVQMIAFPAVNQDSGLKPVFIQHQAAIAVLAQ